MCRLCVHNLRSTAQPSKIADREIGDKVMLYQGQVAIEITQVGFQTALRCNS